MTTSTPETSPKARRRSALLIAGGVLILAVAVILQAWPHPKTIHVPREQPLTEYLPKNAGDWKGADQAMAGTEALEGRVEEILRYDEAVLRKYTKDSREFTVYISYWSPGKIPSREVAFHIPDKCWVFAGWKRQFLDTAYECKVDGLTLPYGQYRIFDSEGGRQHVLYWHLYDGNVILYNAGDSPDNLSMLTDLLKRGIHQRGEQYFIRVASSSPLAELWSDPGFQEVMSKVAGLGLMDLAKAKAKATQG
jgi:hypothetical protein